MTIISTIGAMAADQARLRERIELLTRQVSTGQKGITHGELGRDARLAIDLRGDVARREAYSAAADVALGRMGAAQEVLKLIGDIASNAAAEAARARTLGAAGVDALARSARSAMEEVVALLNTRYENEYLFAGSDLASAPVPNANTFTTGPMAAAIATEVAGLTDLNAGTVLSNVRAISTDPGTRPFSAHLEGPALTEARRAVQVADGERLSWGVLASQDQSGEVDDSWGRSVLRGLATLAALTPANAAQATGYDNLLSGVAAELDGAAKDLAQEEGALGARQARAEAAKERHADLMVALRSQLVSLEQVDPAEVSATLRETQVRLEASYVALSSVANLSLASMLR